MDKYRRVHKEKAKEEVPENEIRITARGRASSYITYAAKCFIEDGKDTVVLKATGTALSIAVSVTEIVKRRHKGLHQVTKIGCTEIVDEYEPLEEGLDTVLDTRQVSFIEITLSKKQLDNKDMGYQPPLPESEVKEMTAEELKEKGRGRKGKGEGSNASGSPRHGSKGGGKGKGKGKGGKGKGKGKGGKGDKGGKGGKGKGGKGKEKGGKTKGYYPTE